VVAVHLKDGRGALVLETKAVKGVDEKRKERSLLPVVAKEGPAPFPAEDYALFV